MSTAHAADFTWRSHIRDGGPGFESRRWGDEQYSELMFWTCSGGNSVTAQYHRDISAWPDADYDAKTFTNCFNGQYSQSQGEWHNLPNGTYYFGINSVGGGSKVDVRDVLVDTTAAD
ncbi:hypothetical protein [Streptomyces sp. NPDC048644]|uniref:hypothetical protein n=1 Tax=Streptomyces sp. NPDC048644 TaxID=3365582 RepID=UPI00371AFABB